MSDAPADDRAGFEAEALPHLDAVYRFSLRLTGAPDQAEDLVQETFLRAFRSWDQYTRGTAAKSWLFTICRNVFLRKRERKQRHDQIVTESVGREGPGPNPVNPVWVSVLGVDPEGDFFESIVDEEIETFQEQYDTQNLPKLRAERERTLDAWETISSALLELSIDQKKFDLFGRVVTPFD